MPPTATHSVLLSEAVLERLPFLRNANVRFFDFGNVQLLEHSVEPIHEGQPPAGPPPDGGNQQQQQQPLAQHPTKPKVFSGVVVITDELLAIASFPANTGAPILIPHFSIIGVSRDGASVIVRNDKMNEVKLTLPKTDAFVVHLIGIQDRAMSRTLRLAGEPRNAGINDMPSVGAAAAGGGGGDFVRKSPRNADPNAVRRAMSLAEDIAGVSSAATDASMERLWGVIRLGRGSARAGPPTTELDEGSDASSVQTVQHVAESPRDDPDGLDASPDGSARRSPRGPGAGPSAALDEAELARREEAEVPPVQTGAASLRRRLWYFFMYYDQTRLRSIDELVAMHGAGDGKQLIKELEQQYGPEPHRFRWSIRDQTVYQREIHSQLSAQLARAQDELLLLKENPHERSSAVARVLRRKEQLVAEMMGDPTHAQLSTAAAAAATQAGDMIASPKDSWRDIFSAVGGGAEAQQAVRRMYNVLSFHDVVQPPARALIEWTLIVAGSFWETLKKEIVALGPVRTQPPLAEITCEDRREMIVANRDFFLAWVAEAHGSCVVHLRHVDGSYCFMALEEAFPHVNFV